MPSIPRLTACAAAILALAACAGGETATAPGTATTQEADATLVQGQGLDFNAALAEAYATMATYADGVGDGGDAAFFRGKAVAAASHPAPEPERAPNGELERARAALMLSMNARDTLPTRLATAQAAYDCWVNGIRSGGDVTPIDCETLFRDTLRDIQARG